MSKETDLMKETPQFKSFFMGGFECAAPLAENKKRIDLLAESKHDVYCREDYRLLKDIGIATVREGLVWSKIDLGNGVYNFERFEKMMAIGEEEGIEQIWDLNHFDFPERFDPFHESFVQAFAQYAKRAVKLMRKYNDKTLYIVPINEISFFSYMAATIGLWGPYVLTRGYDFKKQLVRASIEAMDAIWKEDKNVRFIQVDPVFRRITKDRPTIVTKAIVEMFTEVKFQAFDMLSGKLEPELGGHPKYLDIIGCNYYMTNQEWITGEDILDINCHEIIPMDHPDRVSLYTILKEVYDRYKRPIVVSETGSYGSLREEWWNVLLKQIDYSKSRLPIHGVCAYPVVDRPDWTHWHLTNSGFWDFKKDDKECRRVPYDPVIKMVKGYTGRLREKEK